MLRFTEKVVVKSIFHGGSSKEENHDHHWLVGHPKPLFGGECTSVYATDEELIYIRNNFDNLPFPSGAGKVVWRKEFAQFIYDNLRDESKKPNSFSIEPEPHSQSDQPENYPVGLGG
jgi:hypothetical protein